MYGVGGRWLPDLGEDPNAFKIKARLNLDCAAKRIDGERRYRFPWEALPEAAYAPAGKKRHVRPNPVGIAREWRRSMEERGESQAQLARRLAVTRARVTQMLQILELDPAVLAYVESHSGDAFSERALRQLRGLAPAEQRKLIATLAPPARSARRTRARRTGQR